MGMALFYGNKAQSHADATERWRRLWLAEDELEQRDRAMQLEQERHDAQMEVQNRTLDLQTRQQNWTEKQDNISNALAQNQFDAGLAQDFFESEDQWFETATPLQRAEMISNWDALMGDNEFAAPYIATRKQRLNDDELTVEDALSIATQFVNPKIANANGDYNFVPEFLVDKALKTLKDSDYWGYDGVVQAVDARREPNEETAQYLEQEHLRHVGLTGDRVEAEVVGQEIANDYAVLELEALPGVIKRRREMEENELRAQGIDLEDAAVRQEFLRPFLEGELEELLVGVRGQELANEFLESRMPAELRILAAEAGVSESELEFLRATHAVRVYREELTNEQLEKLITKMDLEAEEFTAEAMREQHRFALSLVAAGHSDMLSLYGDQFFGDLDEEARSELINSLKETANSNLSFAKREREAALLLTQAQTADYAAGAAYKNVQTQYYPETVSQVWADLDIKRQNAATAQFSAETARQGMLLKALNAGPVGMTAPEAFDDALSAMGLDASFYQDGVAALDSMERDLTLLNSLIEGGGDPNVITSLAGRLEGYGISVPDYSSPGSWDAEALQLARNDLSSLIAHEESHLAGLMTTLQLNANQRSSAPISVPDMLGMVIAPFDADDTDSMDMAQRIYTMFMGSSPEAQAAEWEAFYDEQNLESISAGLFDVMPQLSVAVTKLANNTAENGLEVALSDADTLFDGLINGTYSGVSDPELAKEALGLIGVESPADLVNTLNTLMDGQRQLSGTVYPMVYSVLGRDVDLSTPDGMVAASEAILEGAANVGTLRFEALPAALAGLDNIRGRVQSSVVYSRSDAAELEASIQAEAEALLREVDDLLEGDGNLGLFLSTTEVTPFGPGGTAGPPISVPAIDVDGLESFISSYSFGLDAAQGALRDLIDNFGQGLSPSVYGDTLYLPPIGY